MERRKMHFDNGTYIDGKKRIVTVVSNDEVIAHQNPYGKKRLKDCKIFK